MQRGLEPEKVQQRRPNRFALQRFPLDRRRLHRLVLEPFEVYFHIVGTANEGQGAGLPGGVGDETRHVALQGSIVPDETRPSGLRPNP